MIKDLLGALGSWDLRLREGTPSEVTEALDFFGHIAVVRGPVDVLSLGDKILPVARYVGVLRERSADDGFVLGGVGMAVWAGDEDGKGEVIQEWITITNAPLDAALYAVMPSAVTVGVIYNQPGKTYTGRHRFETPREAMDTICAAFGVEWYISGEAKLYAGTTAQLYDTTPDAVVVRKGSGVDLDLTALGGKFTSTSSVSDYSSRVVLLGQHTDFGPDPFITYVADESFPTYFDMYGNPVKRTRLVSETFTTEGSIEARAQLQLNRFNRQTRSLKVSSEKYETEGNFRVGDFAYVYDPESGIFDRTRQIVFRGEVLHPDIIRVTGISYPISADHTVAFRDRNGEWIDLTRWVVFETGTNEITVGDLPRSLGGSRPNIPRDRVDAATGTTTDSVAPAMPEDVQVSTSVIENKRTGLIGQAQVTWAAVTANEDGSVLNDFANYVTAWKLSTASTEWKYAFSYEAAATVDVVPGRNYDFRVAAQDVNGNTSDYSPTVSVLTAADNIPPGPPADPTVTAYLGQLRIEWSGVTATGTAMPPDFNRVDVHVSATSGFTPTSATLVSSLVTKGVAYATAPYGSSRYVKLIAYDNSGNASQASGQVTGATSQVVSADVFDGAIGSAKLADLAVTTAKINDLAVNDAKIGSMSVGKLTAGTISADVVLSGRFATALTGARTEMNASGFYKFNSSGAQLVAIDSSGVLLTGRYRTALTGRRIEMGSAGTEGTIDFWSEATNRTYIRSFTEASGIESIQIGVGNPAVGGLDNRLNININAANSRTWLTSRFSRSDFVVGEQFNIFGAADSFGSQLVGIDAATRSITFRMNSFYSYGKAGAFYSEAYDHRFIVFPTANVPVDVFLDHDGNLGGYYNNAYYGGYWKFIQATQAFTTSPKLGMFTSQGYGGYIRFNGASNYQEIEFKYYDDSFYINARANAFINQSDETSKEQIVDSNVDCVAAISATKVKKYKRTKVDKDKKSYTSGVEIGLLAQEAPAQIVTGEEGNLGIDLYQMCTLLWGAVQQLTVRLDAIDKTSKVKVMK